ncbi:MAG: SPOR domain-containing protein [bacterium]
MEEENLNKLIQQLRDLGYNPVVKKVEVENQTYSRVELGEYTSRSSAEEEARKLEEKGFKPRIVSR